jgi:hypothetical protein
MSGALWCLLGAVGTGTAAAALSTAGCSAPALSQPFLSFGDTNLYALAPGQSPDQFTGSGWTLSRGAHIAPMPVMDGVNGTILDLPTGGVAVSPPICVESDYPIARTLIASTPGASVGVTTSYPGLLPIIPRVQFSGSISSAQEYWQASSAMQVHPGNLPGWQHVQFTFSNTGPAGGNAVIYDFFIDPRMSY